MGTWNIHLFSNDLACDVRDTYMELLSRQFSNDEAYKLTCENFAEVMGTDEEALFWCALAACQWDVGRLVPEVKSKALGFIKSNNGFLNWTEHPKLALRWEAVLKKLENKIESPMPPEKIFRKKVDFVKNPWVVGDIFAYQFHSRKAYTHELLGKYILFQKLSDVEYYKDTYFSVIQVYDKVFDMLPSLADIENVRILPLVPPPGVNGTYCHIQQYIPSFGWFLKSTMIYDRKTDYPQKYLTFVGNQRLPKNNFLANEFTSFFWEKDGMEDWLIDFYLQWRDVVY